MGRSMSGKRGAHATNAKRFEDTIINAKEAAALLRCSVSRVRERAQQEDLPVLGWEGTQPYFKAGDIMELASRPV